MQRVQFVGVLLLSLLPAAMAAQAPNPAAAVARSREALAPVARLVGQWEGEARVSEGPGEPLRVLQSEDIVWGAGGTMIFVRGTGRDPNTRAISFEAAASIWFDPELGRVRMRTHRDGRSVEPTVEIKPDTIVWSFPVPGGNVRYVIALTDTTWHEEGFFERAGAPPFKMIDMRLRRVTR